MPEITVDELKELNTTWKAMKAKLEERDAEIAKYGEAKAETEAIIAKMNERMDQIEVKANRSPIATGEKGAESEESKAQKEAFNEYCRKGRANASPDALKLLSVGDDSQGGFLAPPQFIAEIIKEVVEYSPVRTVARVITTSQKQIEMPRRTGNATATWPGETATTTATNANYGLEIIKANMLVSVAEVTTSLLEDAAFDLASEIQMEMAEQFGKAEGLAFVSGDGSEKPEGILTNANVGFTVNGHASVLQADAVIDLMYAIKTAYANNGTFAMNRTTLAAVRKLKDTTGQYLYEPNQALGLPPTIQGRPYIEAPDMPNIAANSFPILFGDFRRGYVIVDRTQVNVLRDDTTKAEQTIVRFIGRKRVGGQVVLAEALRKLKIAV